jgi:hypothetical protein
MYYGNRTATTPSNFNGYSINGMYFERKQTAGVISYNLKYIVNNTPTVKDTLVATRTLCISPFVQDNKKVIYAGGYDCNSIATKNAAWIYKSNF